MDFYKYSFSFLILAIFGIAVTYFQSPDDNIHIIACDVGQGDAVLVTYKDIQILTDGGIGSSVVDCLSEHIPVYDRDIELVILTHPQADHYEGLIEVVRRYNVGNLLANSVDSSSKGYQVLKSEVGGRGITTINPKEGMTLRLGLIYLDIYNPTNELLAENLLPQEGSNSGVLGAYTTKRDLNDYSVVARLSFKDFQMLLTGDIGPKISDRLSEKIETEQIDCCEYIKVPHHGSKNGMSINLLKAVKPDVAVISVGRDNRYGHPSNEIIEMLNSESIRTLRTDQEGTIEVISDGESVWIEN